MYKHFIFILFEPAPPDFKNVKKSYTLYHSSLQNFNTIVESSWRLMTVFIKKIIVNHIIGNLIFFLFFAKYLISFFNGNYFYFLLYIVVFWLSIRGKASIHRFGTNSFPIKHKFGRNAKPVILFTILKFIIISKTWR